MRDAFEMTGFAEQIDRMLSYAWTHRRKSWAWATVAMLMGEARCRRANDRFESAMLDRLGSWFI